MSLNIARFICSSCGSSNVTFNSSNGTVICNNCGHSERADVASRWKVDTEISGSVLAGTSLPSAFVQKEEIGYRRVTQEILAISPKVVVIEEIPKEEAKIRIVDFLRNYMKSHEHVYPSDVADKLGLKYELVREIFDILEEEGKLEKKAK